MLSGKLVLGGIHKTCLQFDIVPKPSALSAIKYVIKKTTSNHTIELFIV